MLQVTTQLFKLHRKILATILNIAMIGSVSADSIGNIEEATGNVGLIRSEQTVVVGAYLPEVELYDTATTGNGRMLIRFLDKAKLSLTEHTKVLIDEVIYDPNPDKSKMAMKMVFGTARFASGTLGTINKKNIKIETPTAQIAIRGTDFTTTIDELGRSLIVLLPDEFGNSSGEITVTNEAGEVVLNEPYAATMVSTISSMPTSPVTITGITVNMIDNMFIVNPPQDVRDAIEEQADKEANQDQGILDIDFLEFNDLNENALDKETELEFSELDIDFLDVDLLRDVLDIIEELDKKIRGAQPVESASTSTGVKLSGAEIGQNSDSQYNIFIEDDKIVFFRDVNGIISIKLNTDSNALIETIVEGYEGIIELNEGDDSEIIIRQE